MKLMNKIHPLYSALPQLPLFFLIHIKFSSSARDCADNCDDNVVASLEKLSYEIGLMPSPIILLPKLHT